MSLDNEQIVLVRGWCIDGHTLRPSFNKTQQICKWYAQNVQKDTPIEFIFHPNHKAGNVFIHESRLRLVGGPLAVCVSGEFREGQEKVVSLCEQDDPVTFSVIKNFLYGSQINLLEMSFSDLVKVIVCSHRWELATLITLLEKYFVIARVIKGPQDVLTARQVIELGDYEIAFAEYFWECTGRFFVQFSSSVGSASEEMHFENLSDAQDYLRKTLFSDFPNMWELAIDGSFLVTFIQSIQNHSNQETQESLLDIIVTLVEPLMADNDATLRTILYCVIQGRNQLMSLFDRQAVKRFASPRMLRLILEEVALFHDMRMQVSDGQLNGIRSSYCWEVPLQVNTSGERRAFFLQTLQDRVNLATAGSSTCSCTSSPNFHDQLRANVSVRWNVAQSLKLEIFVSNIHAFPDPFSVRIFLTTLQCGCHLRENPPRQLLSHHLTREVQTTDRMASSLVIAAERLRHRIATEQCSPTLCTLKLQVVIDQT